MKFPSLYPNIGLCISVLIIRLGFFYQTQKYESALFSHTSSHFSGLNSESHCVTDIGEKNVISMAANVPSPSFCDDGTFFSVFLRACHRHKGADSMTAPLENRQLLTSKWPSQICQVSAINPLTQSPRVSHKTLYF